MPIHAPKNTSQIIRAILTWQLFATVAIMGECNSAIAAHQTSELSPVYEDHVLPYRISIRPYDFGPASLPTLHSFATGMADGKWVVIGGRTNGLHGFDSDAANNFPPESQNRDVWVIDPVSRESWSRSLQDLTSGLTTSQLNSLTPANTQFYQQGDTLYVTGGYGLQVELPDGSAINGTFDTLSAISLPGLAQWVIGGAGTAIEHIRQVSDPMFRVTGGGMHEIGGRTLLVFGQNFQGNYSPGTNGFYTNQVRSFEIVDDGNILTFANATATTPEAVYRRRDLNVIPILRADADGMPHEELVALSGVFTTTFGAWTVPVIIDADGNPSMDDPSLPETFKQGMNGYHSAKIGLYSESAKEMHQLLFGGISLQYFDEETGLIETDDALPFVNDITSVVIDSESDFSQYRLGEFPLVTDSAGKRIRFGANAEFFLADDIATFANGVIKLDELTQPARIGYIFGGIAANGPHTRGFPDVTSIASNRIFEVVLIPVPEPNASSLIAFLSIAYCLRRSQWR